MARLIDLGIREQAKKYSNLSTVITQHQLSTFGCRLGESSAPGRASFGAS
jgi:hypothetical protein